MRASRCGLFFTTHIHMKIIKFDDVRYRMNINLANEIHSRSFLLAAGHYLSSWPQDWSAADLLDVLRDEVDGAQDERRKSVEVWEGVVHASRNEGVDEHEYALEHIEGLTLDLIAFAIHYASDTLDNSNNLLEK